MKVVHFSSNDSKNGAARSALRLHHGLRALGVDSKMLVKQKYSQDSSIIQVVAVHESPIIPIIEKFYIEFQRTPQTNTCFSLGYPGIACEHEKIVQQADILVFHWITNFLSPVEVDSLLKLQKPIVWVCHDMRAFTGGCHYTAGCRQFIKECRTCPQLKADPFHVVEANFCDQLEIFQQSPITVVAPSQWMAQEARASAIFRKATIKTIPYGLEENIFKPSDQKEARINLGLDQESFIILLACTDAEEERKGLGYLESLSYALLRSVPKNLGEDCKYKITFLFVGGKTETLPHLAFPTKHLHFVKDDAQLQQAYAAADVLLSLSKEDNLPNMVLEAMACGLPIVGFNIGGMGDLVVHGENWVLVSLGDIAGLAKELLKIFQNRPMRESMRKKSRVLVEKKWTFHRQAQMHLRLYEELLEEKTISKKDSPVDFLRGPFRIKKVLPHLFSIAESINRFIEIEKISCDEQLKALALQCGIKKEEHQVATSIQQRKISIIADAINSIRKYFKNKRQHSFKHPDYYWAFDAPKYITHRRKHEGRGWVFHRHGEAIEKIRFKIGDKIFDGFTGYLRPDVALHYQQRRGSHDCGIKALIELDGGMNEIVIEALSHEGRWKIIGSVKVFCAPVSNGKDFSFLEKWNFLKRKKIKKNFILAVQHYLHYGKWGGIGHLQHDDPKPVTYETFPTNRSLLQGETPKISIVTPSYNQGAFLEQTMQSVLQQNYSHLEYVVIDGGSKDNSPQIIKKNQTMLSYCVSEPDQGQSHAIQKGFRQCSGKADDIMAYLNSDDLLLPGALNFVATYFKKHPHVDMIYGHRILVNDRGEEIGRWFTPRHNNYNLSILDYVPQETMFWRRRLYDKIGGIDPNFHFAMDWDFLLRAQESGAVIKRVPYFLGCFRVHEQQKTNLHITTIGDQEVQQLRKRSHGKKTLNRKITTVHVKNLIDSGLAQLLFSLGIRI